MKLEDILNNLDTEEIEKLEISKPVFSNDTNKEELYLYLLKHLAYKNASKKDQITMLYGTSAYFFNVDEMIRQNPNHYYGTIALDITQFKAVNEFCGRKAGDELLKFIGDFLLMLETTRPLTIACHIRADNFCLCTAFIDESELIEIVEQLLKAIKEYPLPYRVHPSFGICGVKEEMPEASLMKDRAMMALSHIKGKFFKDYIFFDDKMHERIIHEREMESDILSAINRGEIKAFIQPKVDMRTGEIIGGEALIRWISPEKGIIPPGKFIPLFEKNGFVISLDKLVWKQIFELQKKRINAGKHVVPLSVNMSRVHIHDDNLIESLDVLASCYKIDPSLIEIELTESAMVDTPDDIFEKMKALQDKGFKFSMDDFGTGYSSLFMLKKQPVDIVKLDREFILELENDSARTILKNTANMLNELGKFVIVEGIETEEQKDILINFGLFNGQGYYFYKPMPIEEFERLLDREA